MGTFRCARACMRFAGVGLVWFVSVAAGAADGSSAVRRATPGRVVPTTGAISMTVTADRERYTPGETIQVRVTASYQDEMPVMALRTSSVTIADAAGRRVVRGALTVQGSGIFSYVHPIPYDAAPGWWSIEVELEDTSHREAEAELDIEIMAGSQACPDADGDGHPDASCGGTDCDDIDPLVHPAALEICGDGVDQDCSGADLPCGEPHATLTWDGPGTCVQCHVREARDVHGSVMYQWKGDTPQMANGDSPQGKAAGAVNSYCINILGNWSACGSCHVGLGALPADEATPDQLTNIDCMLCHQRSYRRIKVDGRYVPDTASMTISMDEAARTVHMPVRANCLQCHAKAGGGDAVKRGDLTLAHASTSDAGFDVHMATTGADLRCQSCHTFTDHRVAGKGSDLRPTDSDMPVECGSCHGFASKDDDDDDDEHEGGGEGGDAHAGHVARVACQTCHIPFYARNASDSEATEATEVHRTWLDSHSSAPPFHPVMTQANHLVPKYRWWNRRSDNALLGDVAVMDPQTGRYPTSRPLGSISERDAKLYAFKYKTALQPMADATGQLIALDTSVFFATADADAATRQGMVNMGLDAGDAYSWVETDTYQMLNHEVSPASEALGCDDCHGSSARMDLQGELGYRLKGDLRRVCVQCHDYESPEDFLEIHDEHVAEERFDCSWCHEFNRPERSLRMP